MANSETLLPCLVILIGNLSAILIIYFLFSRRCGNSVNILTPFLLLGIPSLFLLELVNLSVFGYTGSLFAYGYIFSMYTVGVAADALGFLATPARVLPIFVRLPRMRVPGIQYIFVGIGYALYAPIVVKHIELIASPREIYALTRVGYGIESFLSSFCVYIGLIFTLFNPRGRTVPGFLTYAIPALALLYIHGSKGQLLFFLVICLYFAAFVLKKRFSFFRLIGLGLFMTLAMGTLFYLTFSAELREDLVESVAGYAAEYTRNATLVVDDTTLDPQGGRLLVENTYYSPIPREIFPEKRKDFGSFWLANRYYPDRFQEERGAPAFGLGVLYADFGVFAIFVHAIMQFFTGVILKLFVTRLARTPDEGTFVLFLNFMGVQLIPTGTDFPFVIYYIVATLITVFSRPEINEASDRPEQTTLAEC